MARGRFRATVCRELIGARGGSALTREVESLVALSWNEIRQKYVNWCSTDDEPLTNASLLPRRLRPQAAPERISSMQMEAGIPIASLGEEVDVKSTGKVVEEADDDGVAAVIVGASSDAEAAVEQGGKDDNSDAGDHEEDSSATASSSSSSPSSLDGEAEDPSEPAAASAPPAAAEEAAAAAAADSYTRHTLTWDADTIERGVELTCQGKKGRRGTVDRTGEDAPQEKKSKKRNPKNSLSSPSLSPLSLSFSLSQTRTPNRNRPRWPRPLLDRAQKAPRERLRGPLAGAPPRERRRERRRRRFRRPGRRARRAEIGRAHV